MQHPDITAALREGYPNWQSRENRDTPQARGEYVEEHAPELVKWLGLGYPEILEEFIVYAKEQGYTFKSLEDL